MSAAACQFGRDAPGAGADRGEGRRPRLEQALARSAEACVALAVLVPPLIFGGREAVGQTVLAVLALAGGGFALLRTLVGKSPAPSLKRPEVLLPLAALALSVLAWTPLPPGLVKALSPGVDRLLPGWGDPSDAAGFGGWATFSLAPGLSRDATLQLVPPLLLFWATLAAVRGPEGVRRLFWAFFLSGALVATVGAMHSLFGNGRFYGIWELWWVPTDRQARFPFTNRNHFAGFLALTLGPGLSCLAWQLRRVRSASPSGGARRRPPDAALLLTAAGLTLMLGCTLLSQSRGGAVAAAAALAVAAFGLFRSRGLLAVLGVGLASWVVLFAFGVRDPLQRLARLTDEGQSLDQLTTHRVALWTADLRAVADFPVLGCGPGSHRYVYPLYLDPPAAITYTHAENGYLQVLMEDGAAGAGLLVVMIGCLARWCLRRPPGAAWGVGSAGVTAGLSAALVQGVVDYIWYVPAYTAALAVLAALACRLSRLRVAPDTGETRALAVEAGGRRRPWQMVRMALAVAWLLLAVGLVTHSHARVRVEAAWTAYLRLLTAPASPEDASEHLRRLDEEALRLTDACRNGTGDPDHYYRLGQVEEQQYLARSRNARDPVSLAELRLVLQQGRADSPAAAAALLRARYDGDLRLLDGARQHFRAALECCPLLGLAYLRLGELSFLDGPAAGDPAPYCRQALRVRPHDAEVWFEVGVESCRSGDLTAAGEQWRRACALQPAYQWELLPVLEPLLPADEVVRLLDLDFEGLSWIARRKASHGGPPEKQFVARELHRAVEKHPDRARDPEAWVALHDLYDAAKLPEESEACLRRALALAPGRASYEVRLVHWLVVRGKRPEALREFQQARERFPGDPEVLRLRAEVLNPGAGGGG
jgi:tetratricopeptide (TPR) repeat protein